MMSRKKVNIQQDVGKMQKAVIRCVEQWVTQCIDHLVTDTPFQEALAYFAHSLESKYGDMSAAIRSLLLTLKNFPTDMPKV